MIELDRTSAFLYLLLRDVLPAGALSEMLDALGTDAAVAVEDPLLAGIARRARERLTLTDEPAPLRRPGGRQGGFGTAPAVRVQHEREADPGYDQA